MVARGPLRARRLCCTRWPVLLTWFPFRVLGSASTSEGQTAKTFIRSFGTTHTDPVIMFNLLSCLPNQRSTYFDGYIGGFMQAPSPRYGGEGLHLGVGVTAWSSQQERAASRGLGGCGVGLVSEYLALC